MSDIKVIEIDGELKRVKELSPGTYQFIDGDEGLKEIFLHIDLSDGDGLSPIGIVNDGANSIHVVATLRQTSDPNSDVIPLSGKWRIPIRDDQGHIYDIILVNVIDGVADFYYSTTHRPAVCHIDEKDFEPLSYNNELYLIKIVGNTTFKVYRAI